MNFLPALMKSIGKGLEAAAEGVAQTGERIKRFLSRIGQWLRTQAGLEETKGKDNEQNDGGLSTVFSIIMLFAVVVVAAIFAKRGGFLRASR